MGTEVLRSQDVLSDRFHNPPAAAFHRRRHFPAAAKKKSGEPRAAAATGHVTLLRRGESLDSLNNKPKPKPKPIGKPADDLAARVEPKSPEPLKMYAGSAFSNSPSPQSLPVPSFFSNSSKKKQQFDDYATRDLRRLLRLE